MWLLWLVVCIAFAIAELVYSGFFLMWFSIGAFLTFLLSFFVDSVFIQLLIFTFTSTILLLLLTKPFSERFKLKDNIPTNIDALIGRTGVVTQTIGKHTHEVGLVNLEGEIWSAITTDDEAIEKNCTVVVKEVKGVRLVVSKI